MGTTGHKPSVQVNYNCIINLVCEMGVDGEVRVCEGVRV